MNGKALVTATVIGLILQLAMVIAGHYSNSIKDLFAIGGMGFSLIAGLVFAQIARAGWSSDLTGGAIAGGVCALLGIRRSGRCAGHAPGIGNAGVCRHRPDRRGYRKAGLWISAKRAPAFRRIHNGRRAGNPASRKIRPRSLRASSFTLRYISARMDCP